MPERSADERQALELLGRNLRHARQRAGISQEALGHKIDLHPTQVARIERGQRNPGALTIVKLAAGLGIPAGALLDGLPLPPAKAKP